MNEVLWINPGNLEADDFRIYPLTDSEIKTRKIFIKAVAIVLLTDQRGSRINTKKFIENARDYILEQKEPGGF